MLSRYVQTEIDPIELRRHGVSPARLRNGAVVGALVLLVASLGSHPVLARPEVDLGAIPFIGMIFAGTFGILAAHVLAYVHATRELIVGQPGRVAVRRAGAERWLVVDDREWPSEQLVRVEVHRAPQGEGPDQWFLALVLRSTLVELVFPREDAAVRASGQLRDQLGCAAPVRRRDRPMFRRYALPTLLVFVLAILAQCGAAIWLMLADPRDPIDALPIGLASLMVDVVLYAVARVTAAPLIRNYLRTEYDVTLE